METNDRGQNESQRLTETFRTLEADELRQVEGGGKKLYVGNLVMERVPEQAQLIMPRIF